MMLAERTIGAMRGFVKKSPTLYRAATELRCAKRRLLLGHQHVDGLPGRVHYADLSYDPKIPHHYKIAAHSAIDLIERGLGLTGRCMADVQAALDFACGYGRVLRLLAERLPQGTLDACDLQPQATDFCRQEFSVTSFLSTMKPEDMQFPRQYDLIWVGSLFTHLSGNTFRAWLKKLASALTAQGVLIFTTHGRFSLDILASYGPVMPTRATVAQTLERDNFYFAPYMQGGFDYGFSICTPAFVQSAIDRIDTQPLAMLSHIPRGWDNHQDGYVLAAQARKQHA